MTTPPLDLTALRDAVTQYPSLHMWGSPLVARLLDRVEESDGLLARLSASGGRNIDLLARAEAAERDLAAVTVSRDGWQPRAEAAEAESKVLRSAVETSNDAWAALTTRAEAAEKKVAAVRELHTKTPIYDDQCDDVYCNQEHFEAMDDELYHCATVAYYACEECHKMTDGELDEYPCPTITALDTHTPETETTP